MENAQLDTDVDRVVGMMVEQDTCLLDTFHTFLCLQRDIITLLRVVLDTVVVVVGQELKLCGVLVTLVRMGIVDGDGLLLTF